MIRPLTIATFLLAGASGLYLYESKHEVQLLDRTIERTVRETGALRGQSRLLATEWEMLNNTDRLRQFSDTYLGLKTITPSQFTSLADLDNRLPAPQPVAGSEDEQKSVPVATDTETREAPEPASGAIADETMPVPPVPVTPPAVAVASVARPAEIRPPERAPVPRPAVAESQPRSVPDAHPPEQRQAEQRVARVAEARTEVRAPAPPKPIVLAAPRPASVIAPVNARPVPAPEASRPAMMATAAPYGGSLLGMAHGSVPPAPRPLPVNATYNSN
jgi:hypothetical protein